MRQSRSLIQHVLLTSLIPLLFHALISLFEHPLTHPLLNKGEYQNRLESLALQVKATILQAYSNLFAFTLMLILMNLIYAMAQFLPIRHSNLSEETLTTFSLWSQKKKFTTKSLFEIITAYFAIYCCCSSALNFFLVQCHASDAPRALRSLETTSSYDPASPQQEENMMDIPDIHDIPDFRTLSIGKVVSSLNMNPDSIILSEDNRLAYVITKTYGGLKIIDISDHQYPAIIGSLDLTTIEHSSIYKGLLLSADGKTLFASNFMTLEIINVSNSQVPRLISSTKESFMTQESTFVTNFYLPALALSPDETFLYIAGLGLEIKNITDLSQPESLFSRLSPAFDSRYRTTSLALLPDAKTLVFGNGTLDLLDVSDPRQPKVLNIFPADISISSIILTKNNKIVYAVGFETGSQVMLQKIDISNPMSPHPLGLYDLNPYMGGNPIGIFC